MKTTTRRLLVVVLALPLVVLGTTLAWISSLDLERYRTDISAWLSEISGHAVGIDGGIDFDLLPRPVLRVEGLRLANAGWAADEPMLVVPRLELHVAPLALLRGRLVVPRVVLHDAELLLERNAGGAFNWSPAGDVAAGAATTELVFERLRFDGLRIRYRDARRDAEVALRLQELNLASPDAGGPMLVQARGELAGARLELALSVRTLAALLAARATTLEGRLDFADVTLRFDGGLPAPGSATTPVLNMALQAPGVAALVAAGARLAPGLAETRELAPAMMSLAPLTLSARVSAPPTAVVRLDDLQLRAGDNVIDGWLAVDDTPRLRVDAELNTARLVLGRLGGDADGAARARLFPDSPLPWQWLADTDLDVLLSADEVRLGDATLTGLRLPLRFDHGEGTAGLKLALAGGRLSADARLVAAGQRLRLTLAGEGIELGRLQRELGGGGEIRAAPTSLTAKLRAQGASARALAASLDGHLLVRIGAGRVRSELLAFAGGDLLLGLGRALGDDGDGEMTLECGVARFAVAHGVATAERGIGLRFERANVIGDGSIDLGAETLDLRFALQPREGVGLSAGSVLANLVAVRGTLREPSVSLSGEGVASAGLKVGAAVITGGLSLLAGALYDRVTADDDACATALASRPAAAAAGAADETPAAPRPRNRRNDD